MNNSHNIDTLIDTYQLLVNRYDYVIDHGSDIGEAEQYETMYGMVIADQAVLFAMADGL